mgnify:CR=1 FL=1
MPSCTIASSWLSSHSLPCDMGFLSVGEETRWFAYFSLNKFDNRSITLWYNALCLITLDFPLPTSIQFTHWKLFITSRCVTSIVHRSPYQISISLPRSYFMLILSFTPSLVKWVRVVVNTLKPLRLIYYDLCEIVLFLSYIIVITTIFFWKKKNYEIN